MTPNPRATAWRQTIPWRGTIAWHVHLPPLLADGLSIAEAAEQLDIGAYTVGQHLEWFPSLAERVVTAKQQEAMARAVEQAVAAMRRVTTEGSDR